MHFPAHITIPYIRPLHNEHHGTKACNYADSCPTLRTGVHRIYLAAPLHAQKRGPKCKLYYHRVFNLILSVLYTGMQWKCLPVPKDPHGKPAIHYTSVYKVFADGPITGHSGRRSSRACGIWRPRNTSTPGCSMATDQHRGQKRGDGIGYSGHKHQKGEKVISIIDNHGYVLAPVPVAPVNETDMVLFPQGLNALKQVAKHVDLDLRGAYLNLDGGFDSTRNRKCIFNAGMIPNIPENPRNRKHPKRGRKRLFNAAIHALRMRVERTFAWETSSNDCCYDLNVYSSGIMG